MSLTGHFEKQLSDKMMIKLTSFFEETKKTINAIENILRKNGAIQIFYASHSRIEGKLEIVEMEDLGKNELGDLEAKIAGMIMERMYPKEAQILERHYFKNRSLEEPAQKPRM